MLKPGIKLSRKTAFYISVLVAAAISRLLWVALQGVREVTNQRPMIIWEDWKPWLGLFLLLACGTYMSFNIYRRIDHDLS